MPSDRLIVVGAGGHATVVIDAILAAGGHHPSLLCLVDDDPATHGRLVLDHRVQGSVDSVIRSGDLFHIAIGDNASRQMIYERLHSRGAQCRSIVHPRSTISTHSVLADGVFVGANAVVAPKASLARAVIVNHGAVVDHDCVVGAFSHVAPNASLAGGVSIGARVLVGSGAVVLPGIAVGQDALIGAGAVVTRNVNARDVVSGCPAKRIRTNTP